MFGKTAVKAAAAVVGAAEVVVGAIGVACDHVGPAMNSASQAACKVVELGGAVTKPVAKVAETTFEVTKALIVKRPW
jgi:hypothetical protein